MIKTIFETNRWHIYWQKTGSTNNGNGWKSWSIVFRKVCGTGDDGTRVIGMMAPTRNSELDQDLTTLTQNSNCEV